MNKEKKTITILGLGHRPGDSRIYEKQAKSLAKEYSIVCLRGARAKGKNRTDNTPNINNITFHQHRILIIFVATFYCLRNRSNIYLAHDIDGYFSLALLKILTLGQAKIIFDSHEYYDLYLLSQYTLLGKVFLFCFRSICKPIAKNRFSGYITATEDMQDYFPQKKTKQTLFNFPHTAFLTDIQSNNLLDDTYTYLIYHGGISLERGIQEICESIEILSSKSDKYKLLLIGNVKNNETQEVIDTFISRLPDNIIFTGQLPYNETIAYLKNDVKKIGLCLLHDVGQMNRSIPIKMLEYLALDIPQVGSSNIESYNEMIVFNKCGESASMDKVQDIITKIEEIDANYDTYLTKINEHKKKYTRESEEKKLLSFIRDIS